jgi:5-methyltetrahydropteroyltriglutamate--homocysteine methyltransferase
MIRNTDRILTTHVGSLPRPNDLIEMVQARVAGQAHDIKALHARLVETVTGTVKKQASIGLDIINDGEFGKPSFLHYVNDRLEGFVPSQARPMGNPFAGSREFASFPDYYKRVAADPGPYAKAQHLDCVGPIKYKGHALLQLDIANFKAALAGVSAVEAFMPAIAPSNVEAWQSNKYYKTPEEFLYAIADAMNEEYRAIVDAGLILQIDDPRLVTHLNRQPQMSLADVRSWAMVRIEALNHSLRGIPREKVRFHTCYGINMGPRTHDMELKDVIDILLKINAQAFTFEAANPRHEHEWSVWKSVKLPDDIVLMPGFITQSSFLVEHPDLVAERIVRFASVVGRENVIASADCGFGSFAGADEIDEAIVWAKFESLIEGARRATRQLWGRG